MSHLTFEIRWDGSDFRKASVTARSMSELAVIIFPK